MLEVPNKLNPSSYWVASIVMACGPLLRLRYAGLEEDRTKDFWCDLTKVKVYPLGQCKKENMSIEPPSELLKTEDSETFILQVTEKAQSVPPQLLSGVCIPTFCNVLFSQF